jgi:nucleoside 2-deoxyribosyltransferase
MFSLYRGEKGSSGERTMQIYLAVPLAYNRDQSLAVAVADAIENLGHQITSKWVLDRDPSWGLPVEQVAKRDFDALEASDAIVAEISTPSHGVGMELEFAVMKGKKVICLRRPDSRVSGLIAGTPSIRVLTYLDGEDAVRQVKSILSERANP